MTNRQSFTIHRLSRTGGLIACALTIGFVAGGWHATPSSNRAFVSIQETAASPNDDDAPRLIGLSSCAASRCHGGAKTPAGNDGPAWQSAYNQWTTDVHAGAYARLGNERSNQIVADLKIRYPEKSEEQIRRDHCVSCHSTVQGEDSSNGLYFDDGVNCQSCHGPASAWDKLHVLQKWVSWDETESKTRSEYGYHDMRDLQTRIQQCVQCHVGDAGGNNRLPRDVNHDLIAAGHPRLNFEFHAYMKQLRKQAHWNVENEFYEPKLAWALGQLISGKAAVTLLRKRSQLALPSAEEDSVAVDTGAATQPQPWPEFAEYRCDSCHLPISTGFEIGKHAPPKPGVWDWGSWYFPADRVQRTNSFHKLRTAMAAPAPDPQTIQLLAAEVISELDRLIDQLANTPATADGQIKLAIEYNKNVNHLDAVEQFYLALRAALDARSSPPQNEIIRVRRLEQALMKQPSAFGISDQVRQILSENR